MDVVDFHTFFLNIHNIYSLLNFPSIKNNITGLLTKISDIVLHFVPFSDTKLNINKSSYSDHLFLLIF